MMEAHFDSSIQYESNCVTCAGVKVDAQEKVVPVQTMNLQETNNSLEFMLKIVLGFKMMDSGFC